MRAFTTYPSVDARMPHAAPIFGAHPLGDLTTTELSTEAVGPALLGGAASALNGAVVGGVAGRDWEAAGIGAALSAGSWASWTLLASWPSVGPKTRTALGVTAAVGTVALIAMLVARRKA